MAVSLRFAPGHFYGGTRLSFTSHQISVTHRIADRPPEEVVSHTHTDAHFVLITGGDYVSVAEGNPPEDLPTLIYNPPGTSHRDHFERGRGSFFAFSIEPAKAASLVTGGRLPDGPVFLTATLQHALAQRISRFSTAQNSGLALDALVHELLGCMDRRSSSVAAAAPPWLYKALELLHDRYAEELSIADIAADVGVHPIHLARCFRHFFRCTPGDFARFRRLERAAHLLTRLHRPLAEIALNCGFADQSHLSRTFTRSLGLPPGEYRRLTGIRANRTPMFQIDKNGPAKLVKIRAAGAIARDYARKHR